MTIVWEKRPIFKIFLFCWNFFDYKDGFLRKKVKVLEHETLTREFMGLTFDLTTTLVTVLSCVIVFLVVFICTRNLQMKPTGKQNFIEWVIDFVNNIVSTSIPGKRGDRFKLLGFTLFLFVFVSNMVGLPLVLVIDDIQWWKSPTADPIVTLSLAMMVILMSHFFGVQEQGFKNYFLNSYIRPVPFLLPIKLFEEFTNTLTLALRLYGNIFAGEILIGLIASLANSFGAVTWLVGIPLQIAWQGFSVFIGSIQAFVFTTLSMVYISHKIGHEETVEHKEYVEAS